MISDKNALRKRLENMNPEELSRVYMNLFGTDEGQLVLMDLKNRAYVQTSTMPEYGPACPFIAARNEGRRTILIHIETQLTPEPKEEVINE